MNLNKPEPKTDKAAAEKDTKFVTVSENVDTESDSQLSKKRRGGLGLQVPSVPV